MWRLKGYDYRVQGDYFVTMITKNRRGYFGFVQNEKMCLNKSGTIAWKCWKDIFCHYSCIEGGTFIVMPEHVHGIIKIYPENEIHGLDFDWSSGSARSNSLSTVIGSYKSAVSRQIRKETCSEFGWQRGYYDRVIRNESEFIAINRYIELNPEKYDGRYLFKQ